MPTGSIDLGKVGVKVSGYIKASSPETRTIACSSAYDLRDVPVSPRRRGGLFLPGASAEDDEEDPGGWVTEPDGISKFILSKS